MIALSASKLTCYLQCARRYKFRYELKIAPPWKASALALGSAVHATIETFHQQRMVGASMVPEAAAALLRVDLAAELSEDIKYKDDETSADLARTGTQLVRMYTAANQNVAVTAAEVPFELRITNDVVLRGVFDALLEHGRVRELKTTARDHDAGTLARHVQVSCYSWAFKALTGRDAIIEVVAMLKLKHPRIETHEVTRSATELSWFVELVVEIANAIETGSFPPNPSWACNDCEYGDRCRATGGGP